MRVVARVVAGAEQRDAFLDRLTRTLQTSPITRERAPAVAVTDSVVEGVGGGDDHGVVGELGEVLDPGQSFRMAAGEVRVGRAGRNLAVTAS